MKKRRFLAITGAGLIGVAAGIYGIDRYLENNAPTSAFAETREERTTPTIEFSGFSLGGLLRIIKDTKYHDHMTEATKLATKRMKEMGYKEAILGFNNQVYILGDEEMSGEQLQAHLAAPIICHKDSPIFRQFQHRFGERRELVNDNVEWAVFSPNVISQNNGRSQEEAGLSIGQGIVYVDTQAENGQIRDTREYSAIIAHEAMHEFLRAKRPEPSRLENERLAHSAQRSVAKAELVKEESETLEGMVNTCDHRIKTAEYLQQEKFGSDFDDMYPASMILAEGLLEAGIPQKVLGRYLEVVTGDNELDKELATAAKVALTLHTHNIKRATEILYRWIRTGNDLEKENAASALRYLHPEQLAPDTSGAGWHGGKKRSSGISFGGDGVGTDKTPHLPSLDALLSDARITGKSLFGRLFGSKEETQPQRYEDIQEGDKVSKLSEERKHQGVHIRKELESAGPTNYQRVVDELTKKLPNVQGDPDGRDSDWTYKGYSADRFGTTIVMWQSNSLKIPSPHPRGISEEVFLTKQDRFENGRFMRTLWSFIDQYKDIDFDSKPPKFFKQK